MQKLDAICETIIDGIAIVGCVVLAALAGDIVLDFVQWVMS